ncbi:hypothetical protein CANARDRAFT_30338 [[Candida] arabinofermentans NRRL YB-2248]|uniref:Transcriptional regulatory protein SDS3 n=1 Tax=[Candida] arabinofermentans NRRL YB-2248 TaxID=983967 RepID=A0A1E4SU05_9ASCO|nr:hypothetical protein CANARDRAFT_30338 [[Candida] arabinofermentans NRRL YB-2248]
MQQPSIPQVSLQSTNMDGLGGPPLSKKDKRRQQIQTKLNKIEDQFHNDKDYYYRDSLIQLQYKLSSLHSGDNPQFLQKIKDFEEQRDCELVRLKLSEEYQVQFVNKEFKLDYDKAVEERLKIIELVKLKLHERIVRKIKQLKEDKALLDIATSSSSTTHTNSRYNNNNNGGTSSNNSKDIGYNSGFESSSSFFFPGERRSRRNHTKRYDGNSLHVSNPEDSYDSAGTGTGNGTGNGTGTGYGSGTTSRKRQKVNRNLTSNSRNSGYNSGGGGGGDNNSAGGNSTFGSHIHHGAMTGGDVSSAGEDSTSSKVVTDNPQLNEFLYGEEFLKRQEKVNTRHTSTKTSQGCSGLKPEEITEDLNFLRNAIGAIQGIKKGNGTK